MPSNLPLDDPCQGLPLSNRPMGYWQNMRNLNLSLPDCEDESQLVFLLFEYPGPVNAHSHNLHVYHVDGLELKEVAIVEGARGLFSSMIQKIGNVHYATWDDDITGSANLYCSTNNGLTWDLSFVHVSDFYPPQLYYGPDGSHWLSTSTFDEIGPQLYKSNDDGATWELIHTFSIHIIGENEVSIAVSPLDPNLIVAFGANNVDADGVSSMADRPMVGVSTNGGQSFSLNFLDENLSNTVDWFHLVNFLPNGRAVICCMESTFTGSFVVRGAYNDNPATGGWNLVELPYPFGTDFVCDPGIGPVQVIGDNELIFTGNACLSLDQFTLWRSTDGGESWTLEVSGIAGAGDNDGGKAFYQDGILYVANHFGEFNETDTEFLWANPDPNWAMGEWQILLSGDRDRYEPAWGQALS